jgi:hypothetical protein
MSAYIAYLQKVFNLIDNGDLDWEPVVAICLEYVAQRIMENYKKKQHWKKVEFELLMQEALEKTKKN